MTKRATPKPKTPARSAWIDTAYERPNEPLAPRRRFFRRLGVNLGLAVGLIVVSLAAGMFGYWYFDGLSPIDAFLNAAMIESGMIVCGDPHEVKQQLEAFEYIGIDQLVFGGPNGIPFDVQRESIELFAGLYALYSGLTLVATAGLILAPILHRFLHRFHLQDAGDEG